MYISQRAGTRIFSLEVKILGEGTQNLIFKGIFFIFFGTTPWLVGSLSPPKPRVVPPLPTTQSNLRHCFEPKREIK